MAKNKENGKKYRAEAVRILRKAEEALTPEGTDALSRLADRYVELSRYAPDYRGNR